MHLPIYIAGHCPVSAYALELAAEVRHAFPHIHVSISDVDEPAAAVSEEVLLTPGYFLNGNPIHWGNPTRETLFQVLRQRDQESKGEMP